MTMAINRSFKGIVINALKKADILMTLHLFFAKPEGMLIKANVPPSE